MPITLGYLTEGVYSRHGDPPVADKHDELIRNLEKITLYKFVSDDWETVRELIHLVEGDKFQCMCSCDQLEKNFIVRHVPTGASFTVGSMCISKFGNETMCRQRDAIKRGNQCVAGNIIRDRRTKLGRLGQCDLPSCKCRCAVCIKCGDRFGSLGEDWKTMCRSCYASQRPRLVKCNTCEKFIPKDDWKVKCLDCFKNKTMTCLELFRSKGMKCLDCPIQIPIDTYKTRCYQCWKKTR